MQHVLTIEKLKKSARNLKEELASNGLYLNYNKALQIQCRSLFSKPYEEVIKTIFKKDIIQEFFNPILIIEYNNSFILSFEGDTLLEVDSNTSIDDLITHANKVSKSLNAPIKRVFIPSLLKDDCSSNEIIELTEKMGFFQYEKTIFDSLNNFEHIFINDNLCPFSLNEDWFNDIAFSDDDDLFDTCIWFAETQNDFNLYEFFFSFNDLCNAKYINGFWHIKDSSLYQKDESHLIKII